MISHDRMMLGPPDLTNVSRVSCGAISILEGTGEDKDTVMLLARIFWKILADTNKQN